MSTFYIQLTPYVVDELGALMPLKREHHIMIPDCKDADEAVERLTSKLMDLCDPWRNDGPGSG